MYLVNTDQFNIELNYDNLSIVIIWETHAKAVVLGKRSRQLLDQYNALFLYWRRYIIFLLDGWIKNFVWFDSLFNQTVCHYICTNIKYGWFEMVSELPLNFTPTY